MILLTDISFWQDADTTSRKVDFVKMKAAGASGVIIRAGQNKWADEDFADYWRDAKAAGLPRGTYWFWDSRVPPIPQADLWRDIVGSDLPELGAWCDFEEGYLGSYGTQGHMKDFIERAKVLFPNSVEMGVYTAPYWWRSRVGSMVYWAQYPLWIAHYGVNAPTVPAPWFEWTLWQYTDSGDGLAYGVESKEIDLNRFNGDEAKFRSFFGLGGTTPVPPTGDTMAQYRVKTGLTAKQWRGFVNGGDLSGALANIPTGTVIAGEDAGTSAAGVAVLRRTDVDPDTYVKRGDFDLIGATPPPPSPPPSPAPVTLKSVDVHFDPATGKVATTYTYSDGSKKVLNS